MGLSISHKVTLYYVNLKIRKKIRRLAFLELFNFTAYTNLKKYFRMENINLFNLVQHKGSLKQNIYRTTYTAFQEFKSQAQELAKEYGEYELESPELKG